MPDGVPIPALGNLTKAQFVNNLEVSKYALTTGTYAKITNMLIFAIAPMVFAIKKIFKKA